MTFAHLLATRPDLDEIARCLVGLLSWPVGATGAVVAREADGDITILARYEEPLDPSHEMLRSLESEPCIADIVAATEQRTPVLWTEVDHPSCRPMAAWPLDTAAEHVDHLVLILGAPERATTVHDRVRGIPDVLAVYLAGRPPGFARAPVGNSGAPGGSVQLSQRQSQVLAMMADDLTMQQIASRIGFSESTVRMESLAIYRALGVHDRRHAVAAARAVGLLPGAGAP